MSLLTGFLCTERTEDVRDFTACFYIVRGGFGIDEKGQNQMSLMK
jgi:hypothetical protein